MTEGGALPSMYSVGATQGFAISGGDRTLSLPLKQLLKDSNAALHIMLTIIK